LSKEANPVLDEVESRNLADSVRDGPNQRGKIRNPENFSPGESEMGDGKCSILEYAGTDE
jgi:hypothetical protein